MEAAAYNQTQQDDRERPLSFYSDKRNHHTTSLGLAVGAAYAFTIILMLEICVALYHRADFSTFNFVAAVGGVTGFIVFSDVRRYNVDNASMMMHYFGAITRLWIGTF